jgi:hypothetical protein
MSQPTAFPARPVTLFTRVIFMLAALLAIIAGIQLYMLTERTDHYFAWTIDQPLSATFLGTGYWTGAALLLFGMAERAWANIRVALAAVVSFVPLMLLTTFLHLDRFHLNSTDTFAQVAAWAWVIVYVTVPFAVLAVLLVQLRTPGGDPPTFAPLPVWLRVLLAVNALISLALALALFFVPQALFSFWPWQLTPLTAQAIGVGFFAVVTASFQFLRENSWRRGRVGTVSYLLIGSLQLLALLRYADTVAWERPGSWLYVVFMAAILCGGLYSTIAAWRPQARKAHLAKEGEGEAV